MFIVAYLMPCKDFKNILSLEIALKSNWICVIFPKGMANTSRTFSDVRNVILSAHKNTGAQDKVGFYDTWAENYEQVNLRQE